MYSLRSLICIGLSLGKLFILIITTSINIYNLNLFNSVKWSHTYCISHANDPSVLLHLRGLTECVAIKAEPWKLVWAKINSVHPFIQSDHWSIKHAEDRQTAIDSDYIHIILYIDLWHYSEATVKKFHIQWLSASSPSPDIVKTSTPKYENTQLMMLSAALLVPPSDTSKKLRKARGVVERL